MWVRYAVAAGVALVTLALRIALDPVLGRHAPYLPFTVAIMVAALFGGTGAGLAATVISALGTLYFLIEPRDSFAIASLEAALGLVLFLIVGLVISMLIGRLRDSMLASAHAEEALRRKTQLTDLSHDAIITTDPRRRITGWNGGAEEMYGWAESEALGQVTHEFLNTRNALSNAAIDAILGRESRWEGELRHTALDGRHLVVDSRQVLLRDETGAPAGILEINRDVTEARRAEAEARQASELRRLALESADMGTWTLDAPGGRLSWDDRCAAIYGYPAGGAVDHAAIVDRIHPDDRAAHDEAIQRALSGAPGGSYDREYRVVWPDSSLHWVLAHGRLSVTPGNEDGNAPLGPACFVGVCQDVTERHNADERLRNTQKLESIGLLAGGIAHDFNNLLTVIMGNASAALEECSDCQHYESIISASKRAAYLTKQLLAYAGKGHADLTVLNLAEVVAQAEDFLKASIPKRVALRFHLAQDLPCVEAARSGIDQILMNLVINAGEAIPLKSDGLIEVATSQCVVTPEIALRHSQMYAVAPGPFVCLEVRDNGSGMDEATVAHIFDPFFTTKFTGRGLGLAAVFGIVRGCGGFIEVDSAPGSGTAFRIFLPASAKLRSAASPSAPPAQTVGHSTILVVDDEEMVRRLACTALTSYGYQVLEARNGQDALDVLAAAAVLPALVILDLAMPVMGGDELVPILERKFPGLKVVLTSGYPEEDARKGFSASSVAGFLQKPYTVQALTGIISQTLGVASTPSGRILVFPKSSIS